MSIETVREALRIQADHCARLGSPFTARLCLALEGVLDDSTTFGRRTREWTGDPVSDLLALRVTGALHALVRAGKAPALAALYPPARRPEAMALDRALADAIQAHDADLAGWLDTAPQTNEVARAAVLMTGMLTIAAHAGLPLRLFEVGASAGLNLRLDHYQFVLGGVQVGPSRAPLSLAPAWTGPPPPRAVPEICARRGVDIAPIDVTDACARARLLAYVWPDQPERLARIAAAIQSARADPPPLDAGDAAAWTERHVQPVAGTATVLFHSIAFHYFSAATQAGIAAHMEDRGARAHANAPLAWLRFEFDDVRDGAAPVLRLKIWPGGEDRLLARSHPHGAHIDWLASGD